MSRDCAARPGRWRYVEHLGSRRFLGLLAEAGALLGNSSAGIWESPALGALSINLGGRQEGRLRSAYTLDVTAGDFTGLRCALDAALGDAYRERVRGAPNPYGDGHAAPRVAELLAALPARDVLLRKRFYDGGGDAV
jgi:UDP-N-acetylglucosamine 2-epimerase